MTALKYEMFVREAFGNVNKGDDPAGLARADLLHLSNHDEYLNKIKIALSYSICIYNRNFSNNKKLNDPDDYEKMNKFLEKALSIKNYNDIEKLLNEYNEFREYADNLPENI